MASCSNPDRGTVPKSLFNLCIRLVAENLDLVESFHGFPALIGERIFQSALKCHRFADHNYVQASLKLFTEAFEEEILSSLNISKQHLGLNYYIEDFLTFKDLVELDVSYCGLGDDHEILRHISTLKSLQNLILSYNALSDQGIQKMTTPYRMFQRGPEHLSFVDLKGNDVSWKCLKFFSCFKHLQTVLLPVKHHVETQGPNDWTVTRTEYKPSRITTKGWAAAVINMWMKNSKSMVKSKESRKNCFYSRSKLKEIALEENIPQDSDHLVTLCLKATKELSGKSQNFLPFSGKTRSISNIEVDRKEKTTDDQMSLHHCKQSDESGSELLALYTSSNNTEENPLAKLETPPLPKLIHELNKDNHDKTQKSKLQTGYNKFRLKPGCCQNRNKRKFEMDSQLQNAKIANKEQWDRRNCLNNTVKSEQTQISMGPLDENYPDNYHTKKPRLGIS